MKAKRQDLIIDVLLTQTICTQEELQKALKNRGVRVTQATISRDIKELKLVKKMDAQGVYRYVVEAKQSKKIHEQLNAIFQESVLRVDYAQNITVIQCRHGMANAACASLDGLHWDGLVGTLAGDDTIFVLMKTERQAANFTKELYKYLSEEGR